LCLTTGKKKQLAKLYNIFHALKLIFSSFFFISLLSLRDLSVFYVFFTFYTTPFFLSLLSVSTQLFFLPSFISLQNFLIIPPFFLGRSKEYLRYSIVCLSICMSVCLSACKIRGPPSGFVQYKVNINTSNMYNSTNSFLLLHVSAKLRHFQEVYTQILKTHYSIIYHNNNNNNTSYLFLQLE